MKLSIVSTMYHSANYVAEFCERISQQAQSIAKDDYEIILVNDGSPDHALDVALEAQAQNKHIRIVDLSRNFGHHPAILTGLGFAKGTHVFLIDIDLEEPPEILTEFWETFHGAKDVDVVGGVQMARLGDAQERYAGGLAWKFLQKLSSTELPANLITARLMSQRYVQALMSYKDKEPFLAALCSDIGFKQMFIPVQKTDDSTTTYTFNHKVKLMLNGITAFSTKPLMMSIAVSLSLAAITALVGLYALFMGLFGDSVPGWASTVLLVSAATSIITFLQGMNALYVAHIFREVKQRPLTVIRKIHDFEG